MTQGWAKIQTPKYTSLTETAVLDQKMKPGETDRRKQNLEAEYSWNPENITKSNKTKIASSNPPTKPEMHYRFLNYNWDATSGGNLIEVSRDIVI